MNLAHILARARIGGADLDRRGFFRDSHGPAGVRLRLCYVPHEPRRSEAELLRDYRAMTGAKGTT